MAPLLGFYEDGLNDSETLTISLHPPVFNPSLTHAQHTLQPPKITICMIIESPQIEAGRTFLNLPPVIGNAHLLNWPNYLAKWPNCTRSMRKFGQILL
jgi:hypothetical protein